MKKSRFLVLQFLFLFYCACASSAPCIKYFSHHFSHPWLNFHFLCLETSLNVVLKQNKLNPNEKIHITNYFDILWYLCSDLRDPTQRGRQSGNSRTVGGPYRDRNVVPQTLSPVYIVPALTCKSAQRARPPHAPVVDNINSRRDIARHHSIALA